MRLVEYVPYTGDQYILIDGQMIIDDPGDGGNDNAPVNAYFTFDAPLGVHLKSEPKIRPQNAIKRSEARKLVSKYFDKNKGKVVIDAQLIFDKNQPGGRIVSKYPLVKEAGTGWWPVKFEDAKWREVLNMVTVAQKGQKKSAHAR